MFPFNDGEKVWRSLSVQACSEFVCCSIHHAVKILCSIPQHSTSVPVLPFSQTAGPSWSSLPAPAHWLPAPNPARQRHAPPSSPQNTPALVLPFSYSFFFLPWPRFCLQPVDSFAGFFSGMVYSKESLSPQSIESELLNYPSSSTLTPVLSFGSTALNHQHCQSPNLGLYLLATFTWGVTFVFLAVSKWREGISGEYVSATLFLGRESTFFQRPL